MIFKGQPLYLYQTEDSVVGKEITVQDVLLQEGSTIELKGCGAIFQLVATWETNAQSAYELVRLNDYARLVVNSSDLKSSFHLIDNPQVIELIVKKKEQAYLDNIYSVMVTSDVY